MDFRRFFTYLSNVGMVIFALYLVASIALHHTLYGFKHSNVLFGTLKEPLALDLLFAKIDGFVK